MHQVLRQPLLGPSDLVRQRRAAPRPPLQSCEPMPFAVCLQLVETTEVHTGAATDGNRCRRCSNSSLRAAAGSYRLSQ